MEHWSVWFSAIIAILCWFSVKSFGLITNGFTGKLFSSKFFKAIFEEVMWNMPGGTKRKVKFLKDHVLSWDNENASVSGWKKLWNDKEVIDKNLFEECALDVLPSWYLAWGIDLLSLTIGFLVPFKLIHSFIWLKNLFIASVCSI